MRSQIENLEKESPHLQSLLKDSVKKQREDEHTKALVQNIRDVVYEVEDVVDLFLTKANLRIDNEDISDKPQAWPLRERRGRLRRTIIKQPIQETFYLDVVLLTGMFGLGKMRWRGRFTKPFKKTSLL
ncbi:putative disease resistance RPP13-like protein 3 isoform X1 [Salvia miltiorrhiza]|uniref:putative disease resistance RPP13-like protein 3 isoform X1 n=1 Tax=Salvia miltiorrhiza TaxID=226208 RepID=UPI0025ACDF40|nr:putative disease resistance RPP13-like protein 3 isoform X1 [Salvia miltiorrhiza]